MGKPCPMTRRVRVSSVTGGAHAFLPVRGVGGRSCSVLLAQYLTIPSFLAAASGFSSGKPNFPHWQSLRFKRRSRLGPCFPSQSHLS